MNSARPLGFFATIAAAATQSLLRLYHRRFWWWSLFGIALTFAIGWIVGANVRDQDNGRAVYCRLAWWLQAFVVTPWMSLWLGVQALHGGIEDRTFQYLFLRPVARTALLLGTWVASSLLSAAFATAGCLALFLGLAAHRDLWPDGVEWAVCRVFVSACAIGAVAYAAAAMAFSAWCRRPIVWAALFVVGLQQVTANAPVSAGLRRMTITDPMRRLVLDGIEPDARLARDLWPAESSFRPELIGTPWSDLLWLVGIALAIAAFAYSRIEYDSRARD